LLRERCLGFWIYLALFFHVVWAKKGEYKKTAFLRRCITYRKHFYFSFYKWLSQQRFRQPPSPPDIQSKNQALSKHLAVRIIPLTIWTPLLYAPHTPPARPFLKPIRFRFT
ncbi:unnamed protein product, partial [Ectocarpus sp. 13 AM-2016]